MPYPPNPEKQIMAGVAVPPYSPRVSTPAPVRADLPIEEVVPAFETDVFSESRQQAAFFVGILATPEGAVIDRPAWDAARKLRAKVYIDEAGFLPESSRQEDGGEQDEYDARSVQFGVYENFGSEREARLAGTSRLILKRDPNDLLPVEVMYPEVFEHSPAEVNSTETSRVIARHKDKKMTRKAISLALIRAMAAYSVSEARRPVYAVIDQPVKAMYDKMNFPYELLSDLRYVDDYQSENWAVRIEPQAVIDLVKPSSHSNGLIQAFFAGVEQDRGLGYYDAFLTNHITD